MVSSAKMVGVLALAMATPAAAFHGANMMPMAARLRSPAFSVAAPRARMSTSLMGARMLAHESSAVEFTPARMLPAVRPAGLAPMKASSASSDGIVAKIAKVDWQLIIFFGVNPPSLHVGPRASKLPIACAASEYRAVLARSRFSHRIQFDGVERAVFILIFLLHWN